LLEAFQEITTYSRMTRRQYIELVWPKSVWQGLKWSYIVLQNANVFISIYIPFYLGKCSYTIVADASPHLDTEFVVRSPLHKIIEKHDWPGVMRKSGGQLSINGVKLFSMTIHKLVMSRERCATQYTIPCSRLVR
jgi:hypothetical protein